MRNIHLIFLIVFAFSGCSTFGKKGLSERDIIYAASLDSYPKKEIAINRGEFKNILVKGPGVMRIRLIELFSGANTRPRYRVMGYDKMGPYEMLDIQPGDVLLAANNYVMMNPSLFPDFVRLLSDTNGGTVHILRHGRELILNYKIS
jgi:hypothetical protein